MQTVEDIEQTAATWIARRDSGVWTEADAASLREWLAQAVGHRVAYYRLNGAWNEAGRVRALGGGSAASAPASAQEQVSDAREQSSHWKRRVAVFALAASILVLLAGSLLLYEDELFNTRRFSTVVGGLQTIPLADGSRVTLNTNSEIRVRLARRERVVEIDRGEAFFEVAHDAQRPFIVKAGDRRVIAVGTQFSVRRDGADLRVIVAEGTVRYEGHAADTASAAGTAPATDGVLLPAGSVARAEGNSVQVEQLPVSEAERDLTWRRGVLTFRDTPLANAVAEFNRYNTRKMVIEDPAIAALEVGGVFRANNVDPFVHLLERGFSIHTEVRGDQIVLTASHHR
jgi:transmembrane sensor